jgi:glycosyl transferase, family 25
MQRPYGHPAGGPQHYDGALTMFRVENKDLVRLIAVPNCWRQRSSRSDIHGRWFDRGPEIADRSQERPQNHRLNKLARSIKA